jgi:WD40 repeat protein/predicted Ser/Thr protein kinase
MRELFDAARSLQPAARGPFLEERCPEDAALRAKVLRLLQRDDAHRTPIDEPVAPDAVRQVASILEPEAAPQRIGRFEVIRRVGSGGMGTVYEARQDSPRRTVALKVLRPEVASPSMRRRFENEAQILARLRHPGIAHIYEAGVDDVGRGPQPWFAMELIQGKPLLEHVAEAKLDLRGKLELCARICDAVEHAHESGIVHRDLKPANILVDTASGPKIVDFGIAHWTQDGLEALTRHTTTGQVIGTLSYMSPEQVGGRTQLIDRRCDVYALGVILYEMLTGRLPYNLTGRGLADMVSCICEHEPTRLRSIDHSLHPDIDTIVAKALEKDRTRRYESAAALAEDIRHFLRDEPIVARPQTWSYQFRKFARRNRGLVVGVVLAFIAITTGGLVAVYQAVSATHARDEARRRDTASRQQAYRAAMTAAATALEHHNILLARTSLQQAPASLRGWEWHYLHGRLDESMMTFRFGGTLGHAYPRFLDEDRVIATPNGESIECWDLATGRSLPSRPRPTPELVLNQPGSASVGTIEGGFVVRDETTGRRTRYAWSEFGVGNSVRDILFKPLLSDDGRSVLARYNLSDDGPCWLDLESKEKICVPIVTAGTGEYAMSIDDDDRVAIAEAVEGRPAVWDPRTGVLLALPGAESTGYCLAFSADRRRLVAGMRNGAIIMWDARTLEKIAEASGHNDLVNSIIFRPDGQLVCSTSHDRTVRYWDGHTLERRRVLHGHEAIAACTTFSTDGKLLVTRGGDDTLRIWDTTFVAPPEILRGHTSYVYPAIFSPDGSIIASGGWDHAIRLWDASSLKETAVLTAHEPYVAELAFSSDGRYLVSSGGDGIRCWDVRARRQVGHLSKGAYARFGIRSDPLTVALWATSEDVRVWNPTTSDVSSMQSTGLAAFVSPFISPDRTCFVARDGSGAQGHLSLFRVDDAVAISGISCWRAVAFSPDGRRFAARDSDALNLVNVWELPTGRRLATLTGHAGEVFCIRYHPDGSRIATAGRDQMIHLWDAETFEQIVPLVGHTSYVWSVDWSSDGSRLVSGSGDHTVRVWDASRSAGQSAQIRNDE